MRTSRKDLVQQAREQGEQALLLAVWQHGVDKALLPRYLEMTRRKYKMAGPEYRYYWRHVAGSWLTGAAKKEVVGQVKDASAKARRFLRRIEKGKGNKRVVPVENEARISFHEKLMLEALQQRAPATLAADLRQHTAEQHDFVRLKVIGVLRVADKPDRSAL